MRRNRTIYALAVCACLIFSIVYKSRISAVLLFAVLGYIPLAFVLTFVSLYLIKAGFAESRGVYEKNSDFELGVYISNRSIVGCAPVEILCSIPDRDTGLFSRKRIYASLPPLGKCRISVICKHRYRGSYLTKLERVAMYDPLRIIRLSRSVGAEMTQVFLPRRISLGDLAAGGSGELNSSPTKLISGEREEFSHVRDYRDGDLYQMIHWKLTAKADNLMVKQFDENSEERTLVLCDYNFSGSSAGALMCADGVIETAISFTMAALDAGVRATVDFGTDDSTLVSEVSDRPSFERFYELMSVLPAQLDVCPFTELMKNCAKDGVSVIFLVTARLDEELAAAAELLSQSFGGLVVYAYVNPTGVPRTITPENSSFLFLPLTGDTAKALEELAGASEEK